MRKMFKEYLFHASEVRRWFGFGTTIYCAIFLGTIFLFPREGYGQGLLGDPSSTLGQWGKFKLEVGGGVIDNPNLKIDGKPYSVTAIGVGQSINLIASDTKVNLRSEQFFLTATLGLGSSIDALLKVGQFKIQDPFDGDYASSGGLGFRFSPPQTGFLKMGFLMQAFYATSENNEFNTSVDIGFEPNSMGVRSHVTASGAANDKLRLISYDMLLGVGVQDLSFVRPYAALLVSFQQRFEKGSFSGQGDLTICTTSVCHSANNVPISLSWNTDVSSDSIFGAVLGVSINPFERAGMNLELQLGEGQLGSQYGFMASAFVNF